MLRKNALCWQPEQTTDLHEERLNKVVQTLLAHNVLSVFDLGCGPGELLMRLAGEKQFTTIIGIDTSQEALAEARVRLSFHDEGFADSKMSLCLASYHPPDMKSPPGELGGLFQYHRVNKNLAI